MDACPACKLFSELFGSGAGIPCGNWTWTLRAIIEQALLASLPGSVRAESDATRAGVARGVRLSLSFGVACVPELGVAPDTKRGSALYSTWDDNKEGGGGGE